MFFSPEMRFQSILMSYIEIESNIRALVLLNLLNSLRKKEIKWSAILAFYLFSLARFYKINKP